jgi:aminoglycoside phosphotransferase (APT) family kinase protein
MNQVKTWLEQNNKSIQWLAAEIGASKSLMGNLLNGEHVLVPEWQGPAVWIHGDIHAANLLIPYD